MLKKMCLFIIMLSLLIPLTACSGGDNDDNSPVVTNAQGLVLDKTIIDFNGNKISFNETPSKIFSASLACTEILCALNLSKNISIVTKECLSINGLPLTTPCVDSASPDYEKIMLCSPDIVFLDEGSTINTSEFDNNSIPVIYMPSRATISATHGAISFIASIFDISDSADVLIDELNDYVSEIKSLASKLSLNKTVYFETSAYPDIHTAGRNTLINELITITGSVNIFADKPEDYKPTLEEIAKLNPDVIISNVNTAGYNINEIYKRSGWKNITAISKDNVFYVSHNESTLISSNYIKALEEIAAAVGTKQ